MLVAQSDQEAKVICKDESEFFAPAPTDLLDSLVAQHIQARQRIEQMAAIVAGDLGGVVHYFIEGNAGDERLHRSLYVEKLFRIEGAYAALNSASWSKAIHATDVLDVMPQKRRDEWNESIQKHTCPEFEEATVRNTLLGLLNMRSQFLAERVDGIFRGLSGEHVTNSPAAFGKRMIVGYVLTAYGHEHHSTCGLINDLRCVIAKFMGRDEPKYYSSSGLIRTLKGRWGEWVRVDGGALKIRLYRKGTAHIEVHPDMAWRLNSVLASLYPMAIPPEFRKKPTRRPKNVALIQRPLPFAIIELLAGVKEAYRMIKNEPGCRDDYRRESIRNAVQFDFSDRDKHAMEEAGRVLESLGGVWTREQRSWDYWQFDYDPREVIELVVASGCLPDDKAHQFYPTTEALAQRAVALADIRPDHINLEPEAGTGGLADFMPKDRTRCVEVSQLRCNILTAKGFPLVTCADFLAWAEGTSQEYYDRVVMNPPFDRGQWQSHLEAAAKLVKIGGRLVAILPSSAKSKDDLLPGFSCSFPESYDDAFPGVSVSVVILVADRLRRS